MTPPPTSNLSPTAASDPVLAPLRGIIGSSAPMNEVYRITRQVARSQASVLLLGETGTGKELVAHAIHELSSRRDRPFVRVNCGALSENLLESELFGHVRGAFTGAIDHRTGRFEAAHKGTIFLDEINSTTLHLQVKLLRVLQEREFERVGDTRTVQVDTRVVAASNCDLLALAGEGRSAPQEGSLGVGVSPASPVFDPGGRGPTNTERWLPNARSARWPAPPPQADCGVPSRSSRHLPNDEPVSLPAS